MYPKIDGWNTVDVSLKVTCDPMMFFRLPGGNKLFSLLTASLPLKMDGTGIQSFPFGAFQAYFLGRTISFRECNMSTPKKRRFQKEKSSSSPIDFQGRAVSFRECR